MSDAKRQPGMKLQTVGRNSVFIFASTLVNVVTTLVFVPILARYLGVANYGNYTYVYAFVGMFEAFSTFGLHSIFTRESARDRSKTGTYLGNLLLLKTLLTGLALVITLGASWFLVSRALWVFIFICALETLSRRFFSITTSLFRAYERMEYEFVVNSVDRIVAMVGVILAVRLNWGLIGVFAAFLVGSLAACAVGTVFMVYRFVRPDFGKVPGMGKWFLKASWPIGISQEAGLLYTRIGTFLLGQWQSAAVVGIFSGAYRMYWFGAVRASMSISQAAFPALSRESRDFPRFRKSFFRIFWIVAAGTVALAGALWFISPPFVRLLLGESFEPSVEILRWMCIAIPFTFVGDLYGVALQASDWQRINGLLTVGSLVVITGINWALIPTYGALGAAWAFILGEAFSALVRGVAFNRRLAAGSKISMPSMVQEGVSAYAILDSIEQSD